MLPATLAALAEALTKSLKPKFPHTSAVDALYMLQKRAGVRWADIIADRDRVIEAKALKLLQFDLEAVLGGTPLARIYGEREFYGLTFELSPDTLEPRPDTEVLVNLALDRLKPLKSPRILDLGTGTGCILLSILKNRPDATGIGIDLASGAIKAAQNNAERHNLDSQARFMCGNWGEGLDEAFDLVVSNPPYISNLACESLAPEVKNHDPILALAGGEDGLQAYREIFIQLPKLLKKDAIALFEIGFDQGETLSRLSEESRFSNCRIHLDSGGLPRVAEIKI
jgi:release factor glutamine methyltransferase